ncbi:hypothetical protein Tco_0803938 [Tanacetum coccineum]|uniref:Retrotransposon gag domain-containing protein n=1 Tax=Tanacetum coccineum TaxID=301880 RepID=A0ABQ5A789_9ASTR
MPPKRTSAAPMTAAAVEQLVTDRVSAALANHDTLRNSTNGHGDGSHNSGTGTRGATRTPPTVLQRTKLSSQLALSLGMPLLRGTPTRRRFLNRVCFMPWTGKHWEKLMTVKYCPRGEIKKLEVELWNLKVKCTDIPSYTLRFQELALMCGRMFLEGYLM